MQLPIFTKPTESREMARYSMTDPDEACITGAPSCGNRWCRAHVNEGYSFGPYTMAIAVRRDPTIRRGLGSLLAESQNSFVNDHLRPKMLHLLPGTVPGFSLRNRKWGRVCVSHLPMPFRLLRRIWVCSLKPFPLQLY